MDRQQEFVLRTIEERDIRFIRLWFTDVLGYLKSVAIAPAELEGAFAEGIGFDGSAIEGFARVHEADMLARPDPSTFQVLPWRVEQPGTARMFCDILMPDGTPSYADPRHVLRRALQKAADQGFTFYTHPEVEFFLMRDRPNGDLLLPAPIDAGGYFDQTPHDLGHDFRRLAITMLERMGISVEFSHHEVAPGQQEIDLRYADALTTADNLMTMRLVMKEVAIEQGVFASFMPKPYADRPGSGLHTHLSLFEGDRNAFHEASDPYMLSRTGKAFIAGLLTHAAEITAVTNQWVNSYKRLFGGGEAPAWICWGHNNRSALVRVPMYKPHKGPRPASRSARRTPRATPTWRSRCCSPRGCAASRRATSCPRAPRTTSGRSPIPNDVRWASSRCRSRWPTRSPRWSAPSSSPRRWASTSSSSSCATSGRSGRTTGTRSRRSSWTATCRSCSAGRSR